MNLLQPTKNHRKTQSFGANPNQYPYGPNGHDGVDYGAIQSGVPGDPLYAVDEAYVLEAKNNGPYGNWVKLNLINFNNVQVAYGHAEKINVSVGDHVHMGHTIALMGSTGISTAAHLHFIMWIDGKKVDAEPYLTISYNKYMNELEKLRQDHEDFFTAYGERTGNLDQRLTNIEKLEGDTKLVNVVNKMQRLKFGKSKIKAWWNNKKEQFTK